MTWKRQGQPKIHCRQISQLNIFSIFVLFFIDECAAQYSFFSSNPIYYCIFEHSFNMGEAPTHVYCIICISILKKTTTFFEHSTWFNHSKKKMGKKTTKH